MIHDGRGSRSSLPLASGKVGRGHLVPPVRRRTRFLWKEFPKRLAPGRGPKGGGCGSRTGLRGRASTKSGRERKQAPALVTVWASVVGTSGALGRMVRTAWWDSTVKGFVSG